MLFSALASLVIPLGISGINEFSEDTSRKEKMKHVICTVLFSNIFVVLAYLKFREPWSAYEFLFLGAISAVIFEMLVIPVYKKKCLQTDDLLKTVCFAAVAVAAYSILTYGQTDIHSDTATATILAESIRKHHSLFPKTWNYANGDIWVLSINLPVMLAMCFISNQSLARTVGSLIWVCLAMVGVVYQSRKMFKDKSWMLSVPIFGVFLFNMGDVMLYQAAYTGQLLWISVCTTLLYFIYKMYDEKKAGKYLIGYGILMILLVMSGIRLLAEQAVPALGAVVVVLYWEIWNKENIDWKKISRKLSYMCLAVLVPSGMGYGIYKWLCSWHNVNFTENSQTIFVDSLGTVADNLVKTVLALFECFGFSGNIPLVSVLGIRNMISIIICVILCFVIPFLQWRCIEKEADSVRFFYVFGILHNLIMYILAVFLGKNEARYLLTSIMVFVIISARYIYKYWIKQDNLNQYVWSGLFTVATVVMCIGIGEKSINWANIVREEKNFSQELEQYGVKKGYASYWNAYTNEIYSDLKISFGAVLVSTNGISPQKWLVDDATYAYRDGIRSCLILNENENALISKNISLLFGEPVEILKKTKILGPINTTLEDSEVHVYIFDHDIAHDMNNGLEDGVVLAKELILSDNGGERTSDNLSIYPGGIVYGPYAFLAAGEYEVEIQGKNLDISSYDIYSNQDISAIQYEIMSQSDEKINLRLLLTSNINDLEFHICNYTENQVISVNKIEVKQVESTR